MDADDAGHGRRPGVRRSSLEGSAGARVRCSSPTSWWSSARNASSPASRVAFPAATRRLPARIGGGATLPGRVALAAGGAARRAARPGVVPRVWDASMRPSTTASWPPIRGSPSRRALPRCGARRRFPSTMRCTGPSIRRWRWARPLFIGESTAYREIFLGEGKHYYDLRHCTFDLAGERLAQVLGETTIGVAPSHGPFATFEAAAPLHLAAGHLLLAGPLVPPRGLESGLDHLTFYGPGDFAHLLYEIHSRPAAFEVIRQRGRVRAGRVPRLSHLAQAVARPLPRSRRLRLAAPRAGLRNRWRMPRPQPSL